MKAKLVTLLGVFTLVFVVAGCYSKVTGGSRMGVPFVKDEVMGRYERPLDDVYNAAKQVILFNGTLVNESILHGQTNEVKTLEGRVNQRFVWVRAEQLDPKLTQVTVQARTTGGGRDIDLAHELEKQIALKLVR